MDFSLKLIEAIITINDAVKSGIDSNQLSIILKDKSEETGVPYKELLTLASDKGTLCKAVCLESDKIDNEITELEKRIILLHQQKHLMGSLICHIHGHESSCDAFKGYDKCKYCGETLSDNKKNNRKKR